MKIVITHLTSIYSFILLSVLLIFGFELGISPRYLAILLPVWVYFFLRVVRMNPFLKVLFLKTRYGFVMRILGVYAGLLTVMVVVADILSIRHLTQLGFSLLILPVALHFCLVFFERVMQWRVKSKKKSNKRSRAVTLEDGADGGASTGAQTVDDEPPAGVILEKEAVQEQQRRAFIKLIAGAGAGVFLATLMNPSKASAAFFGSSPGPGVLAIKDTTGAKIDPAIKSPTDGYGISTVDSAAYPAYYGFLNKDGAWYILQENPQNTFLYSAGSANYAANWTNRSSLTYSTYDVTFN